MKTLFYLALLLFSLTAQAFETYYKCTVTNKADRPEVSKLRLPSYNLNRGTFKVDIKYCDVSSSRNWEDKCSVRDNEVFVGRNPKLSKLFAKTGKSYPISCRLYGERDEEQEEEEEDDDPGHGGSTRGGGGNNRSSQSEADTDSEGDEAEQKLKAILNP